MKLNQPKLPFSGESWHDGGMITNGTIKDFFAEKKIAYLPRTVYVDEGVRSAILRRCARVDRKGKVERERRWLGSYYSRELEEEYFPPFEIRWVNTRIGYGVYARSLLLPCAFIGEYTGYVRRKKLFFAKSSDYCFGLETHMGWPGYVIDAEKGGNMTRFLNHSQRPNLEPVAIFHKGLIRIVLRTLRRIEKGEQLTYDYGVDYWRKREDCALN